MPVAGKTGTTSHSHDLWFSGVTPYLSASVWLGYDMPRDLNSYGINSNTAASLWGKIMKKAHEGKEVTDIEMPNGIVRADVCMDSGKAPTDLCRADSRGRVYTEMFIKGTEPKALCEAHVLAKVNSSNDKLANENTPSNLLAEKIFVKKQNPNPQTKDYPYLLPTESDDTIASPPLPDETIENPEINEDLKDETDENQDQDKDKDETNKDEPDTDNDKSEDNNTDKEKDTRNHSKFTKKTDYDNNFSSYIKNIKVPNGYILNPMIRVSTLMKI